VEKRSGTFACAGCGGPLFSSDTKFETHRLAEFLSPLDGAVETTTDRSLFMTRTEVHCAHCGGHLGHVFPTVRVPPVSVFCMNGVALSFEPKETNRSRSTARGVSRFCQYLSLRSSVS